MQTAEPRHAKGGKVERMGRSLGAHRGPQDAPTGPGDSPDLVLARYKRTPVKKLEAWRRMVDFCSGRWREPFGGGGLRLAKKRLAIRSSSEWKVTTTSRPPAFNRSSAALKALRQLGELVIDIEAERLKGPGRGVFRLVALAAEHAGDKVGELIGA